MVRSKVPTDLRNAVCCIQSTGNDTGAIPRPVGPPNRRLCRVTAWLRSLPHAVIVPVGLTCLTTPAVGQYAEIAAVIETVAYAPQGTNGQTAGARRAIHVVCIVGSNEWRIDNDFARNAEVSWAF